MPSQCRVVFRKFSRICPALALCNYPSVPLLPATTHGADSHVGSLPLDEARFVSEERVLGDPRGPGGLPHHRALEFPVSGRLLRSAPTNDRRKLINLPHSKLNRPCAISKVDA